MVTALTYESLYQSRSYFNPDKQRWIPHFWKPQPVVKREFTLFSDDDMPCDPAWGVNKVVEKIIALGLHLELPVGEWVTEGRKTNQTLTPTAMSLLHSNIADEAAHDKGFRYAAAAYPVSESVMQEAGRIAQAWLDSKEHPLEKAMVAETGVFLVSLGGMRLFGGRSLAEVAEEISKDESRHVTTNRGVCRDLGMNPMQPSESLRELVRQTLDYVFSGFSIPEDELGENFDFDLEFCLRSSDDLIEKGIAKELNDMLSVSCHNLPFELKNNQGSYSRVYSVEEI